MPKITYKELKTQIRERRFSPLYVLYGDEQMMVKHYTAKLVEAVAGKQPNDFNYHVFSGDIDLERLDAATQLVPFMSEYNCVLLDDIFFDRLTDSGCAMLLEILKRQVDTTVVILSMPSNVPASKKGEATFKSVVKLADKNGSVLCFEALSDMEVEQYIAKWANENGRRISRSSADRLITLCGRDLTRLKNEVAKLSAYAKGEEITLEDIERLATVNVEQRVFDLADAVISGQGDKAFNVLDRLFTLREEPMILMYLMCSSYIDAYRMRAAGESGVTQKQVASDFSYKNRAFALNRAAKASVRLSTDALRKSLAVLLEADTALKTTSADERITLEQTIARLLLIAREG